MVLVIFPLLTADHFYDFLLPVLFWQCLEQRPGFASEKASAPVVLFSL